jgi:hypothetical protein
MELHGLMTQFFASNVEDPVHFCGNGIAGDMVEIPINLGFPIPVVTFTKEIMQALNQHERSQTALIQEADVLDEDAEPVRKKRSGGVTNFKSQDDQALMLLYWILSDETKVTEKGADNMRTKLGDALDKFECKQNFSGKQFYDRYRKSNGGRDGIAQNMKICWDKAKTEMGSHSSLPAQLGNGSGSDESSNN